MYVRTFAGIIVAITLAAGAVGFVWAVLRSGTVAQAQQEAGNCPGAQTINTTTGSEDKQSPTFQTTGDSFRVTTSITPTSQDTQNAGADADVTSQDGRVIDTVGHDGGGSESSIVRAPPGTYYLDIGVDNANYTFTVEDCTGDKLGGSTTSVGGSTTSGGAPRGGSTSLGGGTTTPNPSPRPTPPNPSPSPTPQPPPPPAPLFNAGGPSEGPVPLMPGGGCPKEFPVQREDACYPASSGG